MTVSNLIVAETTRSHLRQFSPADVHGFYEMNNDPFVLRYTGDKPFASLAEAAKFIATYDHYAQHGFGRWAVLSKKDGRFLGFCGLKRSDQTGEVDLGFRFKQQFWGKGYATESARAALQIGFAQYQLSAIIARAMVSNQASIAVIKKLGMRFRAHLEENNQRWSSFALFRHDWRQED